MFKFRQHSLNLANLSANNADQTLLLQNVKLRNSLLMFWKQIQPTAVVHFSISLTESFNQTFFNDQDVEYDA